MEEEDEDKRRSVRDFIVASDIYRFAFSTRKKKRESSSVSERERRRTSITTIFCARPKETTRSLAASIFDEGKGRLGEQ